ncbi:TPA: class 1b ribonucleoside-diphosphate reductase subunit alpha, partial [Streptococcus pneumoniae]|nr:class 1b ribonucleoside-diphosphate reductase subunit alpha [Streptococcus pneumoniae]
MGLKHLEDVTYFRLNNEINRPVNGQIMLHKDKEALDAFFKENVVPNTMVFDSIKDKINYLIEHNYIETAFIKKYRPEFLEELAQFIKDQNFQFKSFMAAYKFYNQYALKTNDGEYYLENMEDRVFFNALYFADGNEAVAIDIANEIIHQRYQPATPSFLNAGRARRGELVSCFLIQVTDDMNSIGRSINSALQLSRIGGGVGITLSNLREAGAPIKGYEGAASGVVPVMKLFEDSFSYSNQLGQRQGAGVVYLNVFHPDIIAFLSTKKENADEKVRVKTLSLGVVVPDKFYELARKNEEMYLFSPYSVEKEYGVPFNYIDITEKYDELVANPNIRKTKIKARDLETEISKLQQESGYPYVVNIDTANRANPVDGKIIMSNLCSEILQVQEPSLINDAQEFLQMGTDVSCNLGSTNVVNMMTSPDFGRSIRAMVRALTFVTDSSHIVAVPTIDHGNSQAHTFGLGAMGLHSYLAQQLIEYGSPESVEFTSIYFMLMNYWTLVESNNIARERGITFHNFEKSDYANGSYFDKYVTGEFVPTSDRVKELFKNVFIPGVADWAELRDKVQEDG